MTTDGDHWGTIAQRWDAIGPPLRPDAADIDFVVDAARRLHGRRRTIILGVTPELAAAAWPDGTDLWAVDHHAAMVRELWAGPTGSAVLGDWTALPVADGSVDLVVCDGGLHLLDRSGGQPALAAELVRVLATDGRFVLRVFQPPSGTTSVDQVIRRTLGGSVADPNQLKVELWAALRSHPGGRVALAAVWDALAAACPDLDALADHTGWDPSALRALESYRRSPAFYDLVEIGQVVELLTGSGAFALESMDGADDAAVAAVAAEGSYPTMSFPTVTFRRLP